MRTLPLLILIAALVIPATIYAMGSRPATPKQIGMDLARFVASGEVPGLACALITRDGVTYINLGAAGSATSLELNDRTQFHVASVSKLFTSISLAYLVTEGRLSIEDTAVSRLTDGGRLPSLNGKEILVRHLASHTAGLPEIKLGDGIRKEMATKGWEFTYEELAKMKLKSEPGSVYSYSNIGMALLGHIDELADGRPYEMMVVERILSPLGMDETRVALDPSKPKPIFSTETGIFAPAGGFHSCVADLAKFVQGALGNAPEPLARAFDLTYKRIGTDKNGRQLHLGWNEEGDITRLSHTGFQHAYVGIDRANKVGAVILCTGQTLHIGALGHAVVTALSNRNAKYPVPRKVAKVAATRLEEISGAFTVRGGKDSVIVKPDLERGILLLSFDGREFFDMIPESDSVYFCRLWDCDLISPAGKPESIKLKMSGWTGDYDRR